MWFRNVKVRKVPQGWYLVDFEIRSGLKGCGDGSQEIGLTESTASFKIEI